MSARMGGTGALISALLLGQSLFGVVSAEDCDSGPVSVAQHSITFRGVLNDNPSAGQSTWFYTITSATRIAISHVTFSLNCPGVNIMDAGMWDGTDFNSRLSKAGRPSPGSFPAAPAGDPTTQLTGLKFDLPFNDGATHHYYFTLNKNYDVAPSTVALKAGSGFTLGTVCGPSCSEGNDETASVGDFVFLDDNRNGIQDPGEAGVPGVPVRLYSFEGNLIAQTTTDGDGLYLFDNLVAGDYYVEFSRPGGYAFTVMDSGGAEVDSDAHVVTGRTDVFTVATGTHRRDIDAGLVALNASVAIIKNGIVNPGTQDPWAFCDPFGPAHVFNALIFGDFEAVGGDTDGRLAVGGHARIPGGYSVGYGIYGHPIEEYFGGTTDMFIVGGDLEDGAWGVNGNIVHGGERTGPVRWMPHGNVVRKVSPVTFRDDGNVPSDGSGASFADLRDRLEERSERFADMADRGVVSVISEPFSLRLTGNDPRLNVFNISSAIWNGTSKGIFIDAPEGSTVLVNVTGPDIEIRNSSMTVTGTTLEHVLVHYVDATSVVTSGFTHAAAVLAMHADATFSGGSIDGRAVFGGSVSTSVGFEFHNFHFVGRICPPESGNPPTPPHIEYSFTVTNTGELDLVNVTVEDDLLPVAGGPISLAPGESNSDAFRAVLYLTGEHLALGTLTNVAHVVARTSGGLVVTDTDTHVATLPAPETPPAPVLISGNSGELPDLQVQAVDLTPSPTIVGARFAARVRIANLGLADASNVTVDLWSGAGAYSAAPEGDPSATSTVVSIPSGQTVVVEFPGLKAPLETGTRHAMAVVNAGRSLTEQSYGNNHGGATYTLEPLELTITQGPAGVNISWNSVPGYYYFVERSGGLNQPFVDIADNIDATPPVNTFNDPTPGGPYFYRVWGYTP